MSSIHMPPGDAPSESLAEAWAHRAARDHGLPFVDIRNVVVSPLVAELLAEPACRELLAVPIALEDGVDARVKPGRSSPSPTRRTQASRSA